MSASNSSAEQAAPREPRASRRSRTTGGAKALLAVAAERTGDAPKPAPGTTLAVLKVPPAEASPETAVASPERLPESEWTWHPLIGDVAEAKIRRRRAAMPEPIPAGPASCLTDDEMAAIMNRSRPPVLSEAAHAENVAALESRYAASMSLTDSRHTALRARIDARNTEVRQQIDTACHPHRPPAAGTETRALTFEGAVSWTAGTPPPPIAAPEPTHDTGPHPWLDAFAVLGEGDDGCADSDAPAGDAA